MKHLLNDEQKEMFLRRTISTYVEHKNNFPEETGAYKSGIADFFDNVIYVSPELTYDFSSLRNEIEEALDRVDEIDSESIEDN